MTTPPAQPPSTTTLVAPVSPATTMAPVEVAPAPVPPVIQLPLPSWANGNSGSVVPTFRAPTATALVLGGCRRTAPDVHTLVFRVTATGGASWTWPKAFPTSGDTSEQRFDFTGHPVPFEVEIRQFLVRSDDWPIVDYRSGSPAGGEVLVDLPWPLVTRLTCG
jgi:hypothetical protein